VSIARPRPRTNEIASDSRASPPQDRLGGPASTGCPRQPGRREVHPTAGAPGVSLRSPRRNHAPAPSSGGRNAVDGLACVFAGLETTCGHPTLSKVRSIQRLCSL